ncbi:alpha-isopropylmalate synthase regulatory domain-containing protein [Escherichia coli]
MDAGYQCNQPHHRLRDPHRQIRPQSQGEDALGQVDIVAEYKGRKFHGMGLATHIIESSAEALIHVINSIWRADQGPNRMERNVTKTDKINTESV